MRLFTILIDALFPPRDTERVVRELHADALVEMFASHTITLDMERSSFGHPAAREAVALLPYTDGRVRACVVEAKFHNNGRAAALLAHALAAYLTELIKNIESPALTILPLPLSAQRQRERGYNQAERIARLALRTLEPSYIPYIGIDTGLLIRVRNTPPQTTLSGAERRQNLKGAFAIANAPDSRNSPIDPNHTYILLDDVITTGSTMAAAAAELYKGGARSILPLGLAHQAGNAIL